MFGFLLKSFLHPASTSLSSQNFTNLFQAKNDKEQLHPLLPSHLWLVPPSPAASSLSTSQLQKFPTSAYTNVTSHLLISPILLLFPPLLLPFVSHSSVVFSSQNKGMFSSSCLKLILDLICPCNCCFLPLSSINSLNMLFLVPGVPLLIPFLSYLKPDPTTALSEVLYDFQGTNWDQCAFLGFLKMLPPQLCWRVNLAIPEVLLVLPLLLLVCPLLIPFLSNLFCKVFL